MTLSAFENPAHPPAPEELHEVLGSSHAVWKALVEVARGACPSLSEAWHHGGSRFGWSLRLKQKDRVILYLTPQRDSFLAGLVLGERAAQAAEDAPIPRRAKEALSAAPRYAEGRGIRLVVKSEAEVEALLSLLTFKLGAHRPVIAARGTKRR